MSEQQQGQVTSESMPASHNWPPPTAPAAFLQQSPQPTPAHQQQSSARRTKSVTKMWWFWLIIGIVAVLVVGTSVSENQSASNNASENNGSSIANASSPAAESALSAVIVPNVVGQIADGAYDVLKDLGLKVTIKSDTGEVVAMRSNWTVISQSLVPDSEAYKTTEIELVVMHTKNYIAQYTAPVLATDAATLLNDYAQNELHSNDTYKGKLIQVAGVVDRIDSPMFSNAYTLYLNNGSRWAITSIACKDIPVDALRNISAGQAVTIIGRVSSGSSFGVTMENCRLA